MIKLIIALVVISTPLFGKIEAVKSGNWGDSSTWKGGVVPGINDVCYIDKSFKITVNKDSIWCQTLFLNGQIDFNSVGKFISFGQVFAEEKAAMLSDYLGEIYVDSLFVADSVTVEGVHLTVNKVLDLQGKIQFSRRSGVVKVNNLMIGPSGYWEVLDDRSFYLGGKCSNHGTFLAGSGQYTMADSTVLKGSKLWSFSRIELKGILINDGQITVVDEAIGMGAKIINESYSSFESRCAPSHFSVKLDLRSVGNWFVFSRKGNQAVPQLIGDLFYNLKVAISGRLEIKTPISGKGILAASSNSNVNLTEIRSFNKQLKIFAKDSAEVAYSHSGPLIVDTLFKDFDSVIFQQESHLILELEKQWYFGKNIKFKHLEISTPSAALVYFRSDSIVVGDFSIGSEVKVDLQQRYLTISGNCSGSGELFAKNARVTYKSKERQQLKGTNYMILEINNTSSDTLHFFGNYKIDQLHLKTGILQIGSLELKEVHIKEQGSLLVGGASPIFSGRLINHGQFQIFSNHAEIEFLGGITNKGVFVNASSSDHTMAVQLLNDSIFEGCLGTGCSWTIKEDFTLSGSKLIRIPRLKVTENTTVFNEGLVEISSSVAGPGSIKNKKLLVLGMSSDQFEWELDALDSGNVVVYNKTGNQIVSKSASSVFYDLVFSNAGEKTIEGPIQVLNDIKLLNKVSVDFNTQGVEGNPNGHFVLSDSTSLKIGDPLIDRPSSFPTHFLRENINIASSSTVVYAAWKDQEMSNVPLYGNLTLEDGTGVNHTKYFTPFQHDTLVVTGDLKLSESSIVFDVGNHHVKVLGDFLGTGTLKMKKGTFTLEGNGNLHSGGFISGESTFIYQGGKSQKAKRGNYHKVLLNKAINSSVSVVAGSGIFKVVDSLLIYSGEITFGGEEVEVNHLVNKGEVSFNSRFQDKNFNTILNADNAKFDNSYGEDLVVRKSIANFGAFKSSGILSMDGSGVARGLVVNQGLFEVSSLALSNFKELVQLEGTIKINDSLKLISTKLLLSNAQVLLASNASLNGESETNQISGDSVSFFSISTDGIAGKHENIGGLGLSVFFHKEAGLVEVQRLPTSSYLTQDSASISNQFRLFSQADSILIGEVMLNYFEYQLENTKDEQLVGYGSQNEFNQGYYFVPSSVDTLNKQVIIDQIGKLRCFTAARLMSQPLLNTTVKFWAEQDASADILKWCVTPEDHFDEFWLSKSTNQGVDTLAYVRQNQQFCHQYHVQKEYANRVFHLFGKYANGNSVELGSVEVKGVHLVQELFIRGNTLFCSKVPEQGVEVYDVNGRLLNQVETGSPHSLFFDQKGLFILVLKYNQCNVGYKLIMPEAGRSLQIRSLE